MKRLDRLRHVFVDAIPERLDPGALYVSPNHATMLHLCACGCGSEVVTPLSPTDWKITFDGETVSVWPSVGSWSLPCRSHYVIDGGRIRWAGDWTRTEIEAGRARDRRRKAKLHGAEPIEDLALEIPLEPTQDTAPLTDPRRPGVIARFARWLNM